jgi:hypothetical protein
VNKEEPMINARPRRSLFACLLILVTVTGTALAQGRGGPPGGGGGGGSTVDHTAAQTPPIQLGTSGGNANDIANGYCASGTLGALLTDSAGKLFVLSNAHVLAHDIAASSGDADIADLGQLITQPGLIDTRCGRDPNLAVAMLASLSSLAGTTPFSNVDVAVAEVVTAGGPMVRADGAILEIGVIGSTPIGATPGQIVKKSGRTTGLTRSQVDSINATISVQYDDEPNGAPFVRTFSGQIVIRNRGNKFLNAGDSGSLMVQDVATAPRPVGLLYAGSNLVAVANPASDVLAYLNDGNTLVSGATKPLGFVGSAATGTGQAQTADVSRAIAVQGANAARLRSVPRGVGHAVGIQNGVAVIKVLVEQITAEAVRALPARIDGIPVVLEEVGRIVGF